MFTDPASLYQLFLTAFYSRLLPPSALELVTQMLEYDPEKRPSAEDCLKHRYFSEEPAPAPPLGYVHEF